MENIQFATRLPFYSRDCLAQNLSRRQLEKMKACAMEDIRDFHERKATARTAGQRFHANAAIRARNSILSRIEELMSKITSHE